MTEQEKAAQEAAEAEAAKKAAEEAEAAKKKAEEEDPDAGKTAAEIEAEAKEAEEKLKAKKEEEGLSDEEKEAKKKADQIKRRDKALSKLNDDGEESEASKKIATEDLVTLGVKEIDPESDTAKVLQRYKEAGFIKNYQEGLNHPGVKAELEAIKADKDAKSVIDENDSEDAKLATRKERVANYKASGEVPSDVEQQKEIADANLEEMGLK